MPNLNSSAVSDNQRGNMADHEYEGIYSKNQSMSPTLADAMCTSTTKNLMENMKISVVSPCTHLTLTAEQPLQITRPGEVLSPSLSGYELDHLRTSVSQQVVMVTGLDEPVTMLLSTHPMDGGVERRIEGTSGNKRPEEGRTGGNFGETLLMFQEPGEVQHSATAYLNFEQTDSLQGQEGVIQYNVDGDHHEERDVEELNDDIKASSSSTSSSTVDAALMLGQAVLVSESEGFLGSTSNQGVQAFADDNQPQQQQQQVIRVVDLIQATGPNIFRLITNPDGAVSLVSVSSSQLEQLTQQEQDEEENEIDGGIQFMQVQAVDVNAPTVNSLIVPITRPIKGKKLPAGCPLWAAGLNDCERIGDSFRGWVETDAELDSLLTCFKQITRSYWGTRQSPSQSKASTRLMWKSQYVPFDGIPFINASSRAIVMECQYGPRRQSNSKRLSSGNDPKKVFRQSCPARIYIKKVRKFPNFAVNSDMDKKQLKADMDHAFHSLKESNVEKLGEDRYYVQLPTEAAHEFHFESMNSPVAECPHRLHPKVSDKLREVVSGGETRLYVIRNLLRRYVEKELFSESDKTPARHDLTYFPTVNDLQNNIHHAIRDIEAGILPFTAPTVNVEINAPCNASMIKNESTKVGIEDSSNQAPYAQKVTVMLCAKPGEGGQHVISKVETLMSDGTIHISSSLPPELTHIISNVPHPLVPLEDTQQDGYSDVIASAAAESEVNTSNIQTSCKESSTDAFERHVCSGKLSSPVNQGAVKREDLEVQDSESQFSLDGSCDDVGTHLVEDIVEPFCVDEHWRKDLVIGTKRLLEDDMLGNVCQVKKKKLS